MKFLIPPNWDTRHLSKLLKKTSSELTELTKKSSSGIFVTKAQCSNFSEFRCSCFDRKGPGKTDRASVRQVPCFSICPCCMCLFDPTIRYKH